MKISIITPVLNEADNLDALNAQRLAFSEFIFEWILVDGGSTDNTLAKASSLGFEVIQSNKGRAIQQNAGADVAKGDLLLFLHADTRLNQEALQSLSTQKNAEVWGRFDIELDGNQFIFRVIERLINLRSRISKIATGDQGVFVSKTLFEQIGQFPVQPIMEDVEISKRLKKIKTPLCLKQKIETSSRRWEQFGVWKTIWLMWKLRFLYWLGVSPEVLIKKYLY